MFNQIDENNKVFKNIPTIRENIKKPDTHKLIISDHPFPVGSVIDWKLFKPCGEDYIKKSDIELYNEGLKEIPKGMKLEGNNLIPKTLLEKYKDKEITAEEYNKHQTSLRKSSYYSESDPLFFDYQKGEIEKQVWLDKISEIKNKYKYIEV